MKIKVCGMRDGENIRQVSKLGIDYIGFIFWDRSPRNVTMVPTQAGIIPDRAPSDLCEKTPKRPQRVGVFVDEMPQNIITRVVNYDLDVIQLHGHETPTMMRNLRATLDPDIRPAIQIWKAIAIAPSPSASSAPHPVCHDTVASLVAPYTDCVDAFLFDTQTPTAGGSGHHFEWSILDTYDGPKPFMLSGGIGPDDAERMRHFNHPLCMGIDLNSRFETAPAMKDVNLLRQFITALKA